MFSFSKNTSIPTLELGKIIVDTYTQACASGTPGQDTTLSLVDLAELVNTVPAKMAEFAKDTSGLIKNDEYQTVSTARSGTREFAPSSRIDQVDLVHLAKKMGTDSGAALGNWRGYEGSVHFPRLPCERLSGRSDHSR